jgi:hypothetical protein
MPLNLIKISKQAGIILAQFWLCANSYSQAFDLSIKEKEWLGEQIFINECSGNIECTTSWNEGEEFPSLGIGHFIWFQAGQTTPFEETFPALLKFIRTKNAHVPSWLETEEPNSPWRSRAQFYSKFNSPEMVELRGFLTDSRSLQVEFIIQRLNQTLEVIITDFPEADRPKARDIIQSLLTSHRPYGQYALIDYVHFKGTGLVVTERYKNKGWGLRQILEQMLTTPTSLYSFVQVAKSLLEMRVINAPIIRNEQRWLAGWEKRVETYLPPSN